MNTIFPFDRQKAAEAAAEFIRLAGGKINILKLTKLMYLLDRESLEKVGTPVVGGEYFSMKDGPMTSEVLNSINHERGEGGGDWDRLISERRNHEVRLRTESVSTDHLSEFELDLIRELDLEHKNKDRYQLRDWCYDHCQEWVKPMVRKRLPIPVGKLASEIKRTREELENAVSEAQFMAKVFALK